MYNTKTSQLIRQRYSCRTFQKRPLFKEDLQGLEHFIDRLGTGPLGNPTQFRILSASRYDPSQSARLGTYGFIKDPAAFITGAIPDQPGALEDLGFNMELLILKATELEIGSCWLGGTFTKRRFASQADPGQEFHVPAVTALGYPTDRKGWIDRAARGYAGADHRLGWDRLFFKDTWEEPLSGDQAGVYREPLQLVRLGPSASNKQPWRIIQNQGSWHFYLHRTSRYPAPLFKDLLNIADLQRIDLGIAMAHFSLGVQELGLDGAWIADDPGIKTTSSAVEYIISWRELQD